MFTTGGGEHLVQRTGMHAWYTSVAKASSWYINDLLTKYGCYEWYSFSKFPLI